MLRPGRVTVPFAALVFPFAIFVRRAKRKHLMGNTAFAEMLAVVEVGQRIVIHQRELTTLECERHRAITFHAPNVFHFHTDQVQDGAVVEVVADVGFPGEEEHQSFLGE